MQQTVYNVLFGEHECVYSGKSFKKSCKVYKNYLDNRTFGGSTIEVSIYYGDELLIRGTSLDQYYIYCNLDASDFNL